MAKINIKCKTKDLLNLSEMQEFQGDLKTRSDEDYSALEKSIKTHGFSFPFFVWKDDGINKVLDGHGRLEVLKRLEKNGWEIPNLPVIYINCSNENEAKTLLLKLNSCYGKMTKGSVLKFINGDFSVLKDEFKLPIGKIDFIDEFKKINFFDSSIGNVNEIESVATLHESFSEDSNNISNIEDISTYSFANENNVDDVPYSDKNIPVDTYIPPILTKDIPVTSYLFRFGELNFETTVNEYQLFLNFVKQYVEFYETSTGVINELFKRIN